MDIGFTEEQARKRAEISRKLNRAKACEVTFADAAWRRERAARLMGV